MTSWLYIVDENVDHDAIFQVELGLAVALMVGYQLGTYMLNSLDLSPKVVILIGSSISLGGVLMSSCTQNQTLFIVFYGYCSGFGSGILYFVPLVCCWGYFPEHRGKITGVITASYGLGSFFWSQVSTWIVNPGNCGTSIEISENLSYFEAEIAERVPTMLRTLVAIWACMVAISIVLISRPQKDVNEQTPNSINDDEVQPLSQSSKELRSLFSALHSTRFYQYFLMMFLSNIFIGFFGYLYKPIGLAAKIPDSFLALAASIASLVQTATRFFVGFMYDIYGFKTIFSCIMALSVVISILCYPARHMPWLYFLCIQLDYITVAGIFALFPAPVSKTFGDKYGAQVYALILIAGPLGTVVNTFIVTYFYDALGDQNVFFIGTIASLGALMINFQFDEKLDTDRLKRKGELIEYS